MAIIEVQHLAKHYGDKVAVDDVSFSVDEGEVFGILGPNGAGKTTVVECIAGLRSRDRGTVRVLGHDPNGDRRTIREQVGVQLQDCGLPANLRVDEAMELYSSFYAHPADRRGLMEALGLSSVATVRFAKLSGGQRQRLSIALALVGNPRVAVLDELTTGLDPGARRDTWNLIEQVRGRGVTVLLVTHFMEEAEYLCHRVAVINRGRVAALDSPAGLLSKLPMEQQVRFVPSAPTGGELLSGLQGVSSVTRDGEEIVVTGTSDTLSSVITALTERGIVAHGLRVDSPTLDDAYLFITEHDRARVHHEHAGNRREEQIMTSIQPTWTAPRRVSAPRSPFAQLLRTEGKLFFRSPASVVWGALLPVLALIALGLIPATSRDTKLLHGTSYLNAYLPILMAFSLCMCAVNFLPAVLVTYREQGILRRMSTTPVPAARMLGAQLTIYLGVGLAVCAVLALVGFAGFGDGEPRQIPAFVLSVFLIAAATLGIGLVVAAIVPHSRMANAAGAVLFFPLMFLAGLWLPRTQMPTVLRHLSDYSPLGAGVHALQSSIGGQWPPAQPLLILVAYGLITGGVAARWFRWE